MDGRDQAQRRQVVTVAAPTKDPSKTNLPIAVRRAQASDKEAVLSFATRTWDGWDYIPEV